MLRVHLPAALALTLSSCAALAFEPPLFSVDVEFKTGDALTGSTKRVSSLDTQPVMGDQRLWGLSNDGRAWAVVEINEIDGSDPEQVIAVIRPDQTDFIRRHIFLYEPRLEPGQSLLRAIPRCVSDDKLYTHAVILDEQGQIRDRIFIDIDDIPSREYTADDLYDDINPGSPLRIEITRVTPDGGFLIRPKLGFPLPPESPFVAGDYATTLAVSEFDNSPFHDILNFDLRDLRYNPAMGLVFGLDHEGFLVLPPPFLPGVEVPLVTYGQQLPGIDGEPFEAEDFEAGSFELSNAGTFFTRYTDIASGYIVGSHDTGFELLDLELATWAAIYDRDILALSDTSTAVIRTRSDVDNNILVQHWVYTLGQTPVEVLRLGEPVPTLDPTDIAIDANAFRVTDAGDVVMVVRLAPNADPALAYDAIVARLADGTYALIAREGKALPGDAGALGPVSVLDTAVHGDASEQTLNATLRGYFSARFESGDEAFLSYFLSGAGPCPCVGNDCPCTPADLAAPFGQLDFNDALAFLVAFNAADPAADLDFNLDLDFNDALVFLTAYANGCP